MNWGKGLALVMIAFASMMAYFVVRATQDPNPLITEGYYEQELVYQQRIDATTRANALGASVHFTPYSNGIAIQFPAAVIGRNVRGELALIRMNDPSADRNASIIADGNGHCEWRSDLRSGRYRAQLEWRADTTSYYTETDLLVP